MDTRESQTATAGRVARGRANDRVANVRASIRAAVFSLEECAARVPGASVSSLRHLVASGKLKATRPGRRVLVRRVDLAAFLGVTPDELG